MHGRLQIFLSLKRILHYSPLLLMLLLTAFPIAGQLSKYEISSTYTTNQGLPSNNIYKCVQDINGFIWIATENGLSRFDGQKFTNFSTKDGLPDNEIIDLIADGYGNVWIIPFSGRVCLYDHKQNTILTAERDSMLRQITFSSEIRGNIFSSTSVAFYCRGVNRIIIADRGTGKIKNIITGEKGNPTSAFLSGRDTAIIFFEKILYYNSGKTKASYLGFDGHFLQYFFETKERHPYALKEGNEIYKTRTQESGGMQMLKTLPFSNWQLVPEQSGLLAVSKQGKIYTLSLQTYNITDSTTVFPELRTLFIDKEGHYWLGTARNGLIKLSKNAHTLLFKSEAQKISFKALATLKNGLITTNEHGRIMMLQNGARTFLHLPGADSQNTAAVKKIISFGGKHYLVAYTGLFEISKSRLTAIPGLSGFKDAVVLNDSLMVLAGFNQLTLYNPIARQFKKLYEGRSTAVANGPGGWVVFGKLDGLYAIHPETRMLQSYQKYQGLNKRITHIHCTAGEDLIWFTTPADTLYAFNGKSIIFRIPLRSMGNSSAVISLYGQKKGEIWVGSNKVLSRINYNLISNSYTISSFLITVGGQSPIYDIAISGDSLYCTTEQGIYSLPTSNQPEAKNIPVFITDLSIDNKYIPLARHISLGPGNRSLRIGFSGVNLSGYACSYVYRINTDNWLPLNEKELILTRMGPGRYSIEIAAVNIDNTISEKTGLLTVRVYRPFWKYPLFYILPGILLATLLMFYFYRRKERKKRFLLQQQVLLEQQRNKITADLHDELGASLSSLQINSAVAGQLLNKDLHRAQELMFTIERQSRKLSESVGDFIWSMKPGKDEFMTLSSRIKTFAAEMLGATLIGYQIENDPSADIIIKDFALRKNCLLIIKEAVNNAVKYSEGSFIKISLQLDKGKVVITVSDNGIGGAGSAVPGNGIANMKKRAEELKGTLELHSLKGEGTTVIARIPVPTFHDKA